MRFTGCQQSFISTSLQRKIDLQNLVPLLNFGCHRHDAKWEYPPHTVIAMQLAGLIRTILIDREILNELAIHLI